MSNYEKNYNTTNNNENKTTAREDFELSRDMLGVMGTTKDEVVGAKEEAAKARVEQYSTEKAAEQNRLYEEYMEGAIGANFKMQTELVKKELEFERMKADYEIKQAQEKIETERNDLEKQKRDFEKSKRQLVLWRVFWPALGLICGALSYIVLFVLK